jgi:putative tRNA adenosine deaminase-associated protein
VSYFTAVIARDGDKWRAHDVEVEGFGDIGELADEMRLIENEEEPVLVLVEREDAWWAVVRVDADEDPRVFMSDVAGASRSPYTELLAPAETEADPDLAEGPCGGDFDVLVDLGTSADQLRDMCEDSIVPMDALAKVAEGAGFAELLDSLR